MNIRKGQVKGTAVRKYGHRDKAQLKLNVELLSLSLFLFFPPSFSGKSNMYSLFLPSGCIPWGNFYVLVPWKALFKNAASRCWPVVLCWGSQWCIWGHNKVPSPRLNPWLVVELQATATFGAVPSTNIIYTGPFVFFFFFRQVKCVRISRRGPRQLILLSDTCFNFRLAIFVLLNSIWSRWHSGCRRSKNYNFTVRTEFISHVILQNKLFILVLLR
jgi:hypothetical protein